MMGIILQGKKGLISSYNQTQTEVHKALISWTLVTPLLSEQTSHLDSYFAAIMQNISSLVKGVLRQNKRLIVPILWMGYLTKMGINTTNPPTGSEYYQENSLKRLVKMLGPVTHNVSSSDFLGPVMSGQWSQVMRKVCLLKYWQTLKQFYPMDDWRAKPVLTFNLQLQTRQFFPLQLRKIMNSAIHRT